MGAVIGYFESMIPLPFMVSGMRLGLSNIVVLTSLIVFGFKEGFYVSLLKSVVLMLISGNVSSFIYSFSGAFLSSVAMIISLKYLNKNLSLIGISVIGSSFHNLAQILVSFLVIKNIMIFSYLPALLILGIFTGTFVGISTFEIVKNLRRNMAVRHLDWIK